MDFLRLIVDFILHLDTYLDMIIRAVGPLTYLVLFGVIFMETGFVVTPFLPGDSLLFAAGAFAARGSLNIFLLWLLLSVAAVLGDTINYWIGHKIGERAFSGRIRWLKKEYLDRTMAFYAKHGGKTIFLARFVPIVRTFAPFVAGVGRMNYGYFLSFNVIGGLVWTSLFLWLGYFFGNIPFVQRNFELVIIAILGLSVVPIIFEALKSRSEKKHAPAPQPEKPAPEPETRPAQPEERLG